MNSGAVLLEVVRNDLVESVHSGHLLILDRDGREVLALGDIDQLIYPRSAVKSLQTSAMLRAGLELNEEQIALACASHAGSAEHLAVVRSILASVGLDESSLLNTPDKPLGSIERASWVGLPTSIAANCSGKHAAMVATCKANNWDLASYKDPSHPLQLAIANEFEILSGEQISHVAVDGCGAPLFALTLRALARAIRSLALSEDLIHKRVIRSCTNNPVLVSGINRLPTLLMEKVGGLFVKDGAESVMVMATRSGEVIVWKISDGSQRGAGELARASLSHLGINLEIEPEYVMGGGKVVGLIRASKLLSNV
jgi:L-asparaginase II